MAIQANIDDSKIDNFSADAQTTLKKQIEKYADDIIKEANLIEEALREDGASAEITSNTVLQAVRKNKTSRSRKPNKLLLIMKIASSLSLLLTGFFFDSAGYQDNTAKFICCVHGPGRKDVCRWLLVLLLSKRCVADKESANRISYKTVSDETFYCA